MPDNIEITVFMPVYNGSRFLSQAVKSVLDQSFEDFELLIVDDGSTDNSIDIIRSFQDPRIKLLVNDRNEGLSFTRNRGLREARGSFIALLDCDDIALPDRLSIQHAFMTTNSDVALCGGRSFYINKDDIVTGESEDYSGYDLQISLIFQNMFVNSSIMMRSAIALQEGGYSDYAVAEDYDLTLRISRSHKVACLSDFIIKYRSHGENISAHRLEEIRRTERLIIQDTHHYMGIDSNIKLVNAHHSFFTDSNMSVSLNDFFYLYSAMVDANEKSGRYPENALHKAVYLKWYECIRSKRPSGALKHLIRRPLFKFEYLRFKHLRKAFKISFFSVFK